MPERGSCSLWQTRLYGHLLLVFPYGHLATASGGSHIESGITKGAHIVNMYDAVGVAHHVYALQRLVGMQHAEAVVAEGVTEFELVQQRVVLNGVEMHGAVRQVDFVKLLFLRISHVVENRSVRGSSLHALGHQFVVSNTFKSRGSGFSGILRVLARGEDCTCQQGDANNIK